MKTSFVKSVFFCIVYTFSISLIISAQTQQSKETPTITETAQTIKAKRAIIKYVLKDFFNSKASQPVYLLTKNIPIEIQNNFPKIDDLTVEFMSSKKDEVCVSEFHILRVSEKNAYVSFGDCQEGLGYYFEKKNGKWKSGAEFEKY